jgi:hypothetical protein
MESQIGGTIMRCLELRRAKSLGFRFGFDDVTALEYRILHVIEDEMPRAAQQ